MLASDIFVCTTYPYIVHRNMDSVRAGSLKLTNQGAEENKLLKISECIRVMLYCAIPNNYSIIANISYLRNETASLNLLSRWHTFTNRR